MQPLDAPPILPTTCSKSCQLTSLEGKQGHKCANPQCDVWIDNGRRRFHSVKCQQGMTTNARSAIRHLRRYLRGSHSREILSAIPDASLAVPLSHFLESLPDSPGERFDTLWHELDTLDTLITVKGPMDAGTRTDLRTRAGMLAAAAGLDRVSSWVDDYRLLVIRARELLRDVPVEGPLTANSLAMLLGHAGAAVRYFLEANDSLNLGRTLLSLANLYRIAERDREAKQKFRWALHVLKEKCRSGSPIAATLLHEAKCWKLRTVGRDGMESEAIEGEIAQLTRLAECADDPRRWVTHYRDITGFANYLLDDSNLVHEMLHNLTLKYGTLVNHTAWGDPTLATPFIEFLFATQQRDEAIQLVRERYVPLYRTVPNYYNYRKIMRWCKEHKFTVKISHPEHDGAFLSYLPRYSPELV
jgi:hypothetical protein